MGLGFNSVIPLVGNLFESRVYNDCRRLVYTVKKSTMCGGGYVDVGKTSKII